MLHPKFQDHRPFGSGEEDFLLFIPSMGMAAITGSQAWSCDLDHLCKLSTPFPRRLHMKFGFDWPSGFREEDL